MVKGTGYLTVLKMAGTFRVMVRVKLEGHEQELADEYNWPSLPAQVNDPEFLTGAFQPSQFRRRFRTVAKGVDMESKTVEFDVTGVNDEYVREVRNFKAYVQGIECGISNRVRGLLDCPPELLDVQREAQGLHEHFRNASLGLNRGDWNKVQIEVEGEDDGEYDNV